jgi:elongation factor Ts
MALMEQELSLVGSVMAKDHLQKIATQLGQSKVEIASFLRYELGEGIEKKEEDFAKEVEKLVGK